MAESGPGPDPLGHDVRLESLDQRLADAQKAEAARTGSGRTADEDAANASYKLGNRVLAELLGGMIGGALIGWVLDLVLGTKPWLLLAMLFLGIGAAFRNIWKLSTRPK